MTLREVWESYVDSRDFIKKAEWTKKTERKRIKAVLEELGHYEISVLQANPHIVYEFMDSRTRAISPKTKKPYSNTSIRLELAALSAVIIHLVERKVLLDNFMRYIKRPEPDKKKRRVGSIEQAKLIQTTATKETEQLGEDARFVMLLRGLGCRPGELGSLLREDVDLLRREVVFRNTKYKRQDRRAHVTETVDMLLTQQLASSAGTELPTLKEATFTFF